MNEWGGDAPAARPVASIDAALRRWRADEGRLYSVVMVRPDLYERSIEAVRGTVEALQAVTTADGLLAADADGPALAADALVANAMPASELDLSLIAGAAFAMRYAQIAAGEAEDRATAAIAAAGRHGDRWVLLHELQPSRTGGDPEPGHHRLEMRLEDGLGLHMHVDADPSSGRPVFCLDTVRLEHTTGRWLGDAEDQVSATYTTGEEWRAQARRLRGEPPPEAASWATSVS